MDFSEEDLIIIFNDVKDLGYEYFYQIDKETGDFHHFLKLDNDLRFILTISKNEDSKIYLVKVFPDGLIAIYESSSTKIKSDCWSGLKLSVDGEFIEFSILKGTQQELKESQFFKNITKIPTPGRYKAEYGYVNLLHIHLYEYVIDCRVAVIFEKNLLVNTNNKMETD